MNKKQLIGAWITISLLTSLAYASENLIPLEFQYDGRHYKHDEGFKEFESSAKADINGDSKEETIVMFQTRDDADTPAAFAFIYGQDYEFRVPLHDYPGKIEAIDIDHDGKKELFLYSHGGMHYTKLFVFKDEGEKGLHKLFENGSACPVEFEFRNEVPTIKVGRADWNKEGWNYAGGEPLWEVYIWDGKEFVYDKKLSTTPIISEQEEVGRYIDKIHEIAGQKSK